jgi:F-type H+-transporting ATPase subunit c
MYELGTALINDVLAQTTSAAVNLKPLGAALAIGLGGIGPGAGIGIAVNGAMQAIGRNPEAAGNIRTTMIIGAALAEAVAIYALLISLLILFVG